MEKGINLITGYRIPSTIIDGNGENYPAARQEYNKIQANKALKVFTRSGQLIYNEE